MRNGEPVPATGLVRHGDDRVAVAASVALPVGNKDLGAGVPPAVLVLGQRIDAELLARMAEDYGLAGLRLADGPPGRGEAALPLVSPTGEPIGSLAWTPGRPGTEHLVRLAPAMLAALLAFLGFAALAFVSLHRAVGRLRASEERFRDVAEAGSDWLWETGPTSPVLLSERLRRPPASPRRRARPAAAPRSPRARPGKRAGGGAGGGAEPFRDVVCPPGSGRRGAHPGLVARPCATPPATFRATAGPPPTSPPRSRPSARQLPGAARRADRAAEPGPLRERLAAGRWRWRQRGSRGGGAVPRPRPLQGGQRHPRPRRRRPRCSRGRAERLRACVREIDTVARLGGDEFARPGRAEPRPSRRRRSLARARRGALAEPFALDGHERLRHASIGVALVPADGETRTAAQARRHRALPGQAEGRNTSVFEPAMDERPRQRSALEARLRQALERGQLELHYQPLVDARRRPPHGVEALLRWRHPERGLIRPASSSRSPRRPAYRAARRWVLAQACTRAERLAGPRGWRSTSRRSSSASRTWSRRARSLGDERAPAARLELEITEGVLLQTPKTSLAVLAAARGARRAASRWTTSAPATPRSATCERFPFDKIKIDRSFVPDWRERRASPPSSARSSASAAPRHEDLRRGRRDRGAARAPGPGGLRGRPGLPLRPPPAARPLRPPGHGRPRPLGRVSTERGRRPDMAQACHALSLSPYASIATTALT